MYCSFLLTEITRRLIGTVFQPQYTTELESLTKLLHFPEEVALLMSETENTLFYQIPPIDYLRQVTLDMGGPPSPSPRISIRSLVKRFDEVNLHRIDRLRIESDKKAFERERGVRTL